MILTYRYRIKDNSAKKALLRHARAVNQVWNYANALQKDTEDRHRAGAPKRRWASAFDLGYLTSGTSGDLGIHGQTVQEVCRRYTKSRDAAGGAVRFRSSFGSGRSLGWVPFSSQSRQLSGNAVTYLGKNYHFFGSSRRPLPDVVKGGAFVEDARGRWYVALQVDVPDRPTGNGIVGIDLGLKALATCNDGTTVPALRHFRAYERRLAVAQRSGNSVRVRAIHAKVANARRDQLHKASAKIARENSLIVVGNVNAAKLKQTRMAKSVSDAGWSMFRTMLRYKASRHGATFIEADERFTSQLCSDCGSISGPKGIAQLGIRRWDCRDCGASHDRDVNAARNILRVGQSALPHADESRAYRISAKEKVG